MHGIRAKTVFIFSLTLLLTPLALAQSGPDEDEWLPYEESGSGDAKAEDNQQAEAAPAEKPKPKAEKADAHKKPEAEQSSLGESTTEADSVKAENSNKNQADTPDSAPSTPAGASTTPPTTSEVPENKANPDQPAKNPAPAEQPKAQNPEHKQSQTGDRRDDPDFDSGAGDDGETSVFSGPMALDSSIGCLAGSCLPDVAMAGGLGICAGSTLCAMSSTGGGWDALGYLIIGLFFGGGSVYLGSICLGPMSSIGAIVGGVVAALSDDRAWWLPVVAGAPGLLLGIAGGGCLAVPIALGSFSNLGQFVTDQSANMSSLITVLVLSGMAAAISAGPLSLAGIVIADSIWGAGQQGEEQAALDPTKTRMTHRQAIAWPKIKSVKFKQAKQPRSTTKAQNLPANHPATGFVAAY